MSKRIVIIGCGPTGLGAAHRLRELGYENWVLYEANAYAGGHACSFVDDKGFTWDEGGHVIFSHYAYFDELIGKMLGSEVHQRVRESWIRTREAWVPYPYQNNLRYLPPEQQVQCLLGAARVSAEGGQSAPDFHSWILATFGEGIASSFMVPYNLKVWTTPLEKMSKSWIAERVPVLDFRRLLENVVYKRDDVGWGPNSKFKFPLRGGTGEIYRRLAALMVDHIHYLKNVVEVDLRKRTISFADGSGDRYDALISTMPLDQLVRMIRPAENRLLEASAALRHNNLLVLGIGLERKIETTKCWVYFPDPGIPCYRLTYFSNYSPHNVPHGDIEHYSSLMCEVSYRDSEVLNPDDVMDKTIKGLIDAGIMEESDRNAIVSRYVRNVPYSYPIPTLERDCTLSVIQPFLFERGIYSRGRFGAWRYEIGNMDHSVQMGVESINHILAGQPENVFYSP
jgi:protoporphyrinogen oxidase